MTLLKPKLTLPLKETLKKMLTPKELEKAITSYDVLGDIAIIKIPDELLKKEKTAFKINIFFFNFHKAI